MDPTFSSPQTACCPEYADMSRRSLLRGALVAGATMTFGSAVLSASPASAQPARAVLLLLSLRGASDGLSLVVPHGDPVYYQARPRIAVPSETLLAKDGLFGLHPSLAPLLPLWQAGKVATVHASGLPVRNRSHFSAMEQLEDANPGSTRREGWLNRLIGADAITSPVQALSLAEGVPPAALYGPQPYLTAGSVEDVQVSGDDPDDPKRPRRTSLRTLWANDRTQLGSSMRSTFEAVDVISPLRETSRDPQNGATYPGSDLGRSLSEAARIVRGDVGVEVITIDQGDWDMHTDIGTVEWGGLRRNAEDLATAVAAFFKDLGPIADKVTLVAVSEFGRRVQENENWGTDHGYGNAMFVVGGGVAGGYKGTWPGLTNDYDADLLVTTDYRSVLAEVVSARFGASTAAVFPSFTPARVGAMVGK
ncbi:DUF1501 domain-containing protein [Nocardioides bigeumensis]|uniref:DUF1501 domain-containing protein n=1 Tax=Nocardioides bigeumensis TaxID=433657 RepID=A0ABN2Y219_9ACTN